MKMAMANTVEQKLSRINQLAGQVAVELNLVLLDVRFGQQGKSQSLVVSIYRKEPAVGFSDCEQMSRSLERLLEMEAYAQTGVSTRDSYVIEVVSAGIERQLNSAFEFNLFIGELVRVVAKQKIGSFGTEFVGTLLGGDEESFIISADFSLSQKQAGKSVKGKAKTLVDETDSKLKINLQQIYGVYLWPGS